MGKTVASKRATDPRLHPRLDWEHIPIVDFALDGKWHSARLYERERGRYSRYGKSHHQSVHMSVIDVVLRIG